MLVALVATVLVSSVAAADTVVTLGIVERDLTGDGVPEVLSLTGIGETVDRLDVTFMIQSLGRTLYRTTWPMTRTLGFGSSRRILSDAELQTHLQEFGGLFFSESKFMSPEGFVAELRDQARDHIRRIPDMIARDRRYQEVLDSMITGGEHPREARRRAQFALGHYDTPSNLSRATAVWEEMRAGGVTVFEFSVGGDAVALSSRRRLTSAWSCRPTAAACCCGPFGMTEGAP